MDMNELRDAAQKAWYAYGEAIKGAFGFTGSIEASPLLRAVDTADEEVLRDFIEQTQALTARMNDMIARLRR